MSAEFPNPDKILRPGMFARIRVDLGVRKDTMTVPERALVRLQGKDFVWVVDPENKAKQRAVVTGDQVAENVIITEGLKVGERIIVEGIQKATEGAPVQMLPSGKPKN